MEDVVLSAVSKSFRSREGTAVPALEDVSLKVASRSISALVGPTGCGKSTLLRLVAGLDEPDEGRIDVPPAVHRPGEPPVGYLTQRHTLFPWLTAGANVALPLKLRGEEKGEIRRRSGEIMESLGIGQFADLYPYELSGGMQQRTALGRLLASDARCWLLDEPFAALDERTRHRLQDLLTELNRERGVTVIFVTHSIDEAVYIADRVHVFSTAPGRIVDTLDLDHPRPRRRLDDSFGRHMERIRRKIEEVLV